MLGQQGNWLGAWNYGDIYHHTVTVQVRNRDTFAEIALVANGVDEDPDFSASFSRIDQIVSDNGVENFTDNPPTLVAFRRNMTSITFAVEGYKSFSRARWMLNFWS
jgi:hypothetical protein